MTDYSKMLILTTVSAFIGGIGSYVMFSGNMVQALLQACLFSLVMLGAWGAATVCLIFWLIAYKDRTEFETIKEED